ncbi:MAG: Hsp70 family protein, partial [Lachnospiraceae bacterium]|nr:Hsp70 family protein [Candidatus Equihabitans merdae]
RALTGMEPSRNLNPDECVALGASIQGGKLSGESGLNEILLMDVTPLTLAIETIGGVSTPLIPRNTTIPTRHSQIFSTAQNFQSSVEIKVLQGERPFARDNKLLGKFRLGGIRRAMAGVPQIEVTFDIDANGIVNVSAVELSTGKRQAITITSGTSLSDEEVDRAVEEAARYADTDEQRTESLNLYKEVQQLLTQTDTALRKNKKNLDRSSVQMIKSDMAALAKAIRKVKPTEMTPEQMANIRDAKARLDMSSENVRSMMS